MSVRGVRIPVPAVLGALLSFAGWIAVLAFHTGARYVGGGWLLAGIALYVTYRKTEAKPVLRRVTIPERALRHEALEPEFGSILVPVFGGRLDDDIIQTAGRLAAETREGRAQGGSVIEAVWVVGLLFVAYLLVHCLYINYWNPRYVAPLAPLLLVLLAFALSDLVRSTGWRVPARW